MQLKCSIPTIVASYQSCKISFNRIFINFLNVLLVDVIFSFRKMLNLQVIVLIILKPSWVTIMKNKNQRNCLLTEKNTFR